jgi:hypothetical protein
MRLFENTLELLINKLPKQIKLGGNLLDLVIFGYRNEVMYCVLKYRINSGVYFKNKFKSFYDGELSDNLQNMHDFLKEEGLLDGGYEP